MESRSSDTSNWPVHLAGLICLSGYAALASYSHGSFGAPSLVGFFAGIIWVSIPLLLVYLWYSRRDLAVSFQALLVWAVLFRLCGVFGEPLFEDDFFRYLWDGFRFAQDATPYASTPASFFGDSSVPEVFQRVLDQVNYPDIPTIYGPTTELLFLASYSVNPGSLVPLKILLVGLDILLIWLLSREAKTRNLLLYAWCPLVIKEIAFTAHPDILGVTLLIGALLLHKRGRLDLAAACLALAIGAKVFAIFLAPFVLFNSDVRSKVVFLGVLGLLYLPFALQGHTELAALSVFAKEWVFNAAVFDLVRLWMDVQATRVVLALGFAVFLAVYWVRFSREGDSSIPRGDWIFGVFLILAPVVNPWYLLWVLPFAVIYPTLWAWVAAYSVLLSYVTWINLGNFELDPFAHPVWVRPLEFGLILCALLASWLRSAQLSSRGLVKSLRSRCD